MTIPRESENPTLGFADERDRPKCREHVLNTEIAENPAYQHGTDRRPRPEPRTAETGANRNHLERLSAEHGVSLNIALEADSLSLQTQIVAKGGIYALLGPYAIAGTSKDCGRQSSKLVDPVVPRNICRVMDS
jgi:hypothetical protein